MKQLINLDRAFYAPALIVCGFQQLYFGTFRDVFFSVYQNHLPLLFLMIFLWVWLVHVPDTLSHPIAANRGNLLASTFDALAFSGITLLIALTMKKQQWVEDIENWK